MAKSYKHYRMPSWIWSLPPKILSGEDKRFLSFVWWSGFQTCHCHNWWLQLKFHCARRTVQYRIQKLKRLKFISIGQPNNHLRTLYPRALKDRMAWFAAMANLKPIKRPEKTWLKAMQTIARRQPPPKKKCH